MQARGLVNEPDLASAFAKTAVAHQEAQKFIGQPAEKLIRLPDTPTDADGWSKVWQRLGAPKDAAGYNFEGIKFADGTDLDANFVSFVRNMATDLHLPADAGREVMTRVVKYMQDSETADTQIETAAKLAAQETLKTSWGANYEANKFVASQAAQALGIDKATVDALEQNVSYDKIMEMFRQIGVKIGEDRYVATGGIAGGGPATYEGAVEQKAMLTADTEFVKKALAGDVTAVKQLAALDTIIARGRQNGGR